MLDNHIDFDEASKAWRKNKKQLKNGCFEYICNFVHSNGKQCRKSIVTSKNKNLLIYGFGGCILYDKYSNHPNKDYYCSKHINRYKPVSY